MDYTETAFIYYSEQAFATAFALDPADVKIYGVVYRTRMTMALTFADPTQLNFNQDCAREAFLNTTETMCNSLNTTAHFSFENITYSADNVRASALREPLRGATRQQQSLDLYLFKVLADALPYR